MKRWKMWYSGTMNKGGNRKVGTRECVIQGSHDDWQLESEEMGDAIMLRP